MTKLEPSKTPVVFKKKKKQSADEFREDIL